MAAPAAPDPREELITALRAILAAPGTSGKALEAKASAARQLARLQSLVPHAGAEEEQELPPDPIAAAGLDELAPRRRRHF
jgi:hypothetical protein